MDWKLFKSTLCSYLQIRTLFWLKPLVAEKAVAMPDPQGSMVYGKTCVKMESFGHITSFFGPLGPPVCGYGENTESLKVSSKTTKFNEKVCNLLNLVLTNSRYNIHLCRLGFMVSWAA